MYAVHTCILSNPVKTSNNINDILVNPFTLAAYVTITASNHPHLLDLPVTVPNSRPLILISSPISLSNSVTNGPSPTLVV